MPTLHPTCGKGFIGLSELTANTASIIFPYPVQRHKTPPSASSTSHLFGIGFFRSKACAATNMPGVQIPHCAAPWAKKLSCRFEIMFSALRPSMLVTLAPSTWATVVKQLQIGSSSRSTLHAPQSPALHPIFVPESPISLRSTSLNRVLGKDWLITAFPFNVKQVMPSPHLQNTFADQLTNAEQPQPRPHAGIGQEREHHQSVPIR